MPIEFRCSGCEKLLRTADHTSGLPAKCPVCGALQTIPDYYSPLNLAAKAPQVRRQDYDWEQSHRAESHMSADNTPVMSVLLGVAALMTSCCLPLAFPVALIGLMLGIRSIRTRCGFLAIAGTVLSLLGVITTMAVTFLLLFQ